MNTNTLLLDLTASLVTAGQTIATAESCTGGLIAGLLTELPGSSAWFERGFVTYSNLAKEEMLGVPAELIHQYGAVSQQVAEAMAQGALRFSAASLSLAVTGIAGPDGGTLAKPVGTVWLAFASRQQVQSLHCYFENANRQQIRQQTCEKVLAEMFTRLKNKSIGLS